ncbi:MAG TPA: Ig-like domain-containing protein [Longimicrobium sp.]|nr:Ig-like domain-containing protein [Longimicrobium sp.]
MDKLKRIPAFVLLLLSGAACQDGDPVGPPDWEPTVQLAQLECTVTVAGGEMKCASLAPGVGDGDGLIVGGQGTRVFLQATNHASGAGTFSIDVTVENLIPQALGTTDGVNKHADAVRIFFYEEPTAADGSGLPVAVANHHGTDIFTTSGQKYFKYDQILLRNQTSEPVNWQFTVAPGLASFRFSVLVAAAVQYPNGWIDVTPAADTMAEGGTQPLTAVVRNAVGDVIAGQTVSWGTSDGDIATVSASGLVTGVGPGTATITATSGVRSGTATVAVCPVLALGQVYVADMPAGESLCLSGDAQYTVVPVNTATAGSIALQVTGAGIVSPTEPPSPALFPGGARLAVGSGPRPDYDFERRLRQMERRDLPGRDPNAGVIGETGPRLAITPGVPAVGALMSLNVETDNACSTFDTRTGRVMAVGTRVIVIADTTNPSGGLTAGDYAAIADSFDTRIHPVVTGAFGTPSDRDNNQRVIAFYTRAVNELTPPASGAYVGGFFFSRDLRSAADCPTSNVGEMFYMLAADPSGVVNGNKRDIDFIMDVTFGTLAHEYQHLINASRRMLVNTPWNGQLEEIWLDEGLAHIAEELMFYAGAGVGPRSNLEAAALFDGAQAQTAFFRYAEANYARLRRWLLSPHTNGPFQNDGDLATRGAIWAFLRYAADRRGGTESTFWNSLVNTGNTGLANLQAVVGTDPLPWFRDFGAAMYADDMAPGGSPQAIYTQPSWNFRDVYANLDYDPGPDCDCIYPLVPGNLTNGVAESVTLSNGGAAAYLRLRVVSSAFAGITVHSGGATPPATVRLAVIRRQ